MMLMIFRTIMVAFALLSVAVHAGQVEIVMVTFDKQGSSWNVSTTLRHADSGWDHYADAWRVIAPDGHVLGTRTLYHPHVEEQPFSRSLANVVIPAGLTSVFVEAHDHVHGWSAQRVRIDITTVAGARYRVNP
ncbi:MAG: hypothetical protein ACE5LB_03690 [Acidiferrobacterales bacterium]